MPIGCSFLMTTVRNNPTNGCCCGLPFEVPFVGLHYLRMDLDTRLKKVHIFLFKRVIESFLLFKQLVKKSYRRATGKISVAGYLPC